MEKLTAEGRNDSIESLIDYSGEDVEPAFSEWRVRQDRVDLFTDSMH